MNAPIPILFLWTRISGYMSSCWRQLSEMPELDVHVIARRPQHSRDQAPFSDRVVNGFQATLLAADEAKPEQRIREAVARHAPRVVVVAGWAQPVYNRIARELRDAGCRVVMTMDTPWRGDARQVAGTLVLRRSLRHVDHVVVASERAWQYAKRLGFQERNISRGLYAWDEQTFGDVADHRLSNTTHWPRNFLFVGRYVEEKGLDVMVEAYRQYRQSVDSPWPLTCCGCGPLQSMLRGEEGICDRGFVQPDELPDVLLQHGVFVLPSRYEPWGVAMAEAMGTGMPVICSEACGAGIELHQHLWTGWRVATGDPHSLAHALANAHCNLRRLPEIAKHCKYAASAVTHTQWARRWRILLEDVYLTRNMKAGMPQS